MACESHVPPPNGSVAAVRTAPDLETPPEVPAPHRTARRVTSTRSTTAGRGPSTEVGQQRSRLPRPGPRRRSGTVPSLSLATQPSRPRASPRAGRSSGSRPPGRGRVTGVEPRRGRGAERSGAGSASVTSGSPAACRGKASTTDIEQELRRDVHVERARRREPAGRGTRSSSTSKRSREGDSLDRRAGPGRARSDRAPRQPGRGRGPRRPIPDQERPRPVAFRGSAPGGGRPSCPRSPFGGRGAVASGIGRRGPGRRPAGRPAAAPPLPRPRSRHAVVAGAPDAASASRRSAARGRGRAGQPFRARAPMRSSRDRASSPRVAQRRPGRGPRPGPAPAGRREPGQASGRRRIGQPVSPRIASISRTATGPSRSRTQRDRTVGSSWSSRRRRARSSPRRAAPRAS